MTKPTERPYKLTVTIKVVINGDSKELAIDHLGMMLANEGLAGIEMAALAPIVVSLDGEEIHVPVA